jgi:anti-anti-sigma factor
MEVSLQHYGRCLVVTPHGPLVAGGPAEDFERAVQDLIRHGYPHMVADLGAVPSADSAGIRALVRAHATAQRRGLVLRLAQPTAPVRQLLALAHLDTVLPIFESVETARARALPWATIGFVASALAICSALVWAGMRWDVALSGLSAPDPSVIPGVSTTSTPSTLLRPFLVVVKLLAAALVGVIVTGVHRPAAAAGRASRAMEQAQVLLCVSGAMMMIIIGDSLARAFGIAGAASIIRFRTPVDDPKDVTVLFLLMGLGMAIGLGAFAAAGLATLFLCVFLVILARASEQRIRTMMLEVVSDSRTFPLGHVQAVLARNQVIAEPREVEQDHEEAVIRYHTTLPLDVALEDLSTQLVADGARGVKSVSWEAPKKSVA